MTEAEVVSREVILATPAGLEMDRLVAERVMGFRWFTAFRGELRLLLDPAEEYDPHKHPCWPLEECDDMSLTIASDNYRYIPKFSTQIAAAWLVIELVRNAGLAIHLQTKSNGCVWTAHLNRGPGSCWEAQAETPPLAVCRAALLITLLE